jgi:sialate O-acetylesterase
VRTVILALALAHSAPAAVTLPYLIASHMVVQRGLPVHIWGKADPAESVTVSFRGASRITTADPLGRWSVYLPPSDPGGPFILTVNAIALDDILVGDVWIASGQSNMEWPVSWAADPDRELAAAGHPRIRLVRAMHKTSEYPLDNLTGEMWRECTPQSAATFSAVAYHFGRLIQQKTGVPAGLIQTAWGGTPIDAWTSLRAISQDPALMPVFAEWDARMQAYPLDLLRYERSAKTNPPPEKPVGLGSPWEPGVLYNAMIAPITKLAIRGVIWYQGEANGSKTRAPLYGRLFQAMIQDWRRAWRLGDFPFLYVQLANYNAPESDWPELREGQRDALALRNTAMTVAIDVGTPDNIHPPDKRTIGERLSLAARALAYGESVEYSGPLPRQAIAAGSAVQISFDHDAGLIARGPTVHGFELAADDRKFVPAAARIEGRTVVVTAPEIARPAWVRYAWKDNPECNLFNGAGLPASPFRVRVAQ